MPRAHLISLILAGIALSPFASATPPTDEPARVALPTVDEARQRARLLHGTIHDTLQVVHAQYFREDEKLIIPAASLELVFQDLEERSGVKLRWLVVEGRAMNVDHNPKDEFEKEAVRALASGKVEHEQTASGVYRFAGSITLQAECLKCHMPSRSSNDSRAAGLLISMPVVE